MFKRSFTLTLISFLTLNAVFAQDCLPDISKSLPEVNIPELNLHVSTNTTFCFDPSAEKNAESLKKFNNLKDKNAFDDNNCLVDKKFDQETNDAITDLITQTTRGRLNVYAADPNSPDERTPLIMTNSTDSRFVNKAISKSQWKLDNSNKLNTKDTLEIAGATAIGTLVGIVTERNSSVFKNPDGSLQHDKVLHSNYGAMINVGSVGAAYLAIETSGLGDKFKMTKIQKKWAILLTGTLVGLLVGYGKERFYDYYHQGVHTYDPHLKGDMGATWLGGGAFNFIGGSITFRF